MCSNLAPMQDVTARWRRIVGTRGRRDLAEISTPLAHVIRSSGSRVIGIAGVPGAGKSTIASQVAGVLRERGHDPFTISLDDYYLSKAERAARGIAQRGPPGTHDVHGLLDALDRIGANERPITVKRFSHELDEQIEPMTLDDPPTHVLLEGWVLGHREDGYGAILDRLDLLVFLDVDDATAKRRRYEREAALREHGGGFSEEGMNRFWDEVIAPGLELWVGEGRSAADLVIEAHPDGRVRRVLTSSALVDAAIDTAL